jgi:hypothetical protein
MDWDLHRASFLAHWMIRYMHPSESSWKQLLDYFILRDARGKKKYPEGRMVIASKLSAYEKRAMLKRLPQKAKYIRECLKEFWKLKLTPVWEDWEHIGADPLWHSHRIDINCPPHVRSFCKHRLKMLVFSDVMDNRRNRLFRREDWEDFIKEDYERRWKIAPDNAYILHKADAVMRVVRQIPRAARLEMRKVPEVPIENRAVYLLKEGQEEVPAVTMEGKPDRAELIWVDGVGVGHPRGKRIKTSNFMVVYASNWGSDSDPRWAGPVTNSYPCDVKWKLGSEEIPFKEMSIKKLTRNRAYMRMKPPPAAKEWRRRLRVNVRKMFEIKSFFTTPRDQVTWMKVWHRNLWVANRDRTVPSAQCNAWNGHRCTADESILHLAKCRIIRRDFWSKVISLMRKLDLTTHRHTAFIIAGRTGKGKIVDTEAAGVMFIAWRCLYAEVVGARIEDRRLRLKAAYARMILMVISRLKAQGAKWFRWFSRVRFTKSGAKKAFPLRYRYRKLMTTRRDGSYKLNPTLENEFKKVQRHLRTV